MIGRFSELYGRLLAGLALAGCAVLFFMMLVICADVLLRAWPWLHHVTNVFGLAVCAVLVLYGVRTILNSAQQGAMVFKSVVFPEWWLYAPVPLCFGLLAIEFGRRLAGR